jgi:AraC-like DNA-binding protein
MTVTNAPRTPAVSKALTADSAAQPNRERNFYREFPPPAPDGALTCVWTRTIGDANGALGRIVPDGCVDIVWFGGAELLVAGPDTQPVLSQLPAGAEIIGARLRPGLTLPALGVPADELLDQRVLLRDIWGDAARRLVDQLSDAPTLADRFATLAAALAARQASAGPVDADVQAIIARIARQPSQRIAERGSELQLSQRQLRRRFSAAVGYGPKTFARIMRFQALLARAQQPSGRLDLASLAAEAGYSDQAHMAREVRRLAGATPTEIFSPSP